MPPRVHVVGDVCRRAAGTENPALAAGSIVVVARNLKILSRSEALPFPISEKAMVAGVPREMLQGLSAEESASFRAALDRLGHAGVAVRDVDLPEYPLVETAHRIIGAVKASSSCGKYNGVRYGHRASAGRTWNDIYLRTRGESFSPLLK